MKTTVDSYIESKLKQMKNAGQYIGLCLFPPIGQTVIHKDGNRMYINEGRDGEFENVSESFYDEMVEKFDSRKH